MFWLLRILARRCEISEIQDLEKSGFRRTLNLHARKARIHLTMRIDEILLRQIGPFEDARILLPKGQKPDLADVYLLTGPNGSGKSTALYTIANLIGCGVNPISEERTA